MDFSNLSLVSASPLHNKQHVHQCLQLLHSNTLFHQMNLITDHFLPSVKCLWCERCEKHSACLNRTLLAPRQQQWVLWRGQSRLVTRSWPLRTHSLNYVALFSLSSLCCHGGSHGLLRWGSRGRIHLEPKNLQAIFVSVKVFNMAFCRCAKGGTNHYRAFSRKIFVRTWGRC